MFKINNYFDGNVTSIGFNTGTLPATVGVMAVGEYVFSTSEFETMTVVSGTLRVKLPDADDWRMFEVGQTFTVDANQTFNVKVMAETAYLCTYGKS